MNSKPIFTTPPSTQLLPKEYAVIRAYMLGLSDQTLMQLLQIDQFEIKSIWIQLFKKYERNNSYVLIRKIIQLGLIEGNEKKASFFFKRSPKNRFSKSKRKRSRQPKILKIRQLKIQLKNQKPLLGLDV